MHQTYHRTVPTARLGSGTANSSTFLRGDSTFAAIDLSDVTGATGDFSIADKIVHTGDTDTAIRFLLLTPFQLKLLEMNR